MLVILEQSLVVYTLFFKMKMFFPISFNALHVTNSRNRPLELQTSCQKTGFFQKIFCLEIIKFDMKVLEVCFTPHCIDNLVGYTLITIETNFNINTVKKNAKMLPPPLNFEECAKNKANCQKKIVLRKPTELQV